MHFLGKKGKTKSDCWLFHILSTIHFKDVIILKNSYSHFSYSNYEECKMKLADYQTCLFSNKHLQENMHEINPK